MSAIITNLFEFATRQKLRFDTTKGSLTTEDLWDLPLTSTRGDSLDAIARNLSLLIREQVTESFVVKATKADEILELKFALVKYVIDVRLAEDELAKAARETKKKKERLLEIIARKQDQALEQASLEELQGMVAAL